MRVSGPRLSLGHEERAVALQTNAEMFQGLRVLEAEVRAYVRTPRCRDALLETLAQMRVMVVAQDELLTKHLRVIGDGAA